MQHYDGNGHLSNLDYIVFNGMPQSVGFRPGSGTYTVNPNCTGTAVIKIPSSPAPPLEVHFVVVGDGREIRQVVDGNAITAIGKRVE